MNRGAAFLIIGASIARQFGFLQPAWVNDGDFVGLRCREGPFDDRGQRRHRPVRYPAEPFRRRVKGLPRFVTTRGGESFFIPGIRALQWIAKGQ